MRSVVTMVLVGVLGLAGVEADRAGAAKVAAGAEYLPGQIIVDPGNAAFLVYNRDADGDGALDLLFLIGPGDPAFPKPKGVGPEAVLYIALN